MSNHSYPNFKKRKCRAKPSPFRFRHVKASHNLRVLSNRGEAKHHTLKSEKGTAKVPRRNALKDREPLSPNPRHSLVELVLCNHPFEKVGDELLPLRCKDCSALIDGICFQDVPTPGTFLLRKS